MKNILILTSEYCGKAKANGICAKALAESFDKFDENVSVYVVSADFEQIDDTGSDKIRSVYVPKVAKVEKKRSKLFYAVRLLKNIALYSYKVNYNKQMVALMLTEAEKICRDVSIDAVICMYFPLESVVVGSILKKYNSNLKLIIYELDSVVDGIAGSGKFNKYMLRASKRTMSHLYKKCDVVMIMDCHKDYWLNDFSAHQVKMRLTDLPLLLSSENNGMNISNNETVICIYAGNLDSAYRSPKSLIETFKKINIIDWSIDFFSKGCEEDLENFKKCCDKVRLNGYVDQHVLNSQIEKADVLLSIGNKVSNSLPSKIITYMTYGKPIIHFSLQDDDICKKYLNKYPLSLVIEKDENSVLAAKKIVDFIKLSRNECASFEEICENFPKNVPFYSTQMIFNTIKKEEKDCSEKKD